VAIVNARPVRQKPGNTAASMESIFQVKLALSLYSIKHHTWKTYGEWRYISKHY